MNPTTQTKDLMHDLRRRLQAFAAEFDRRLDPLLPAESQTPQALIQAVRYSALAPGKRIRPYLVVRCCELAGGARDAAWPAAAAIECIHAFSLVHDDLPAMDDDDLRRGQPTTHKKFGEALAILAGDALATLAFELVAREYADCRTASAIVLELARAAGWSGMIGGQAEDLLGQKLPPQLERTRSIHARKTARLFAAACRIGAIAGGGDEHAADSLACFGMRLGEAFQIADDVLDVTGAPARLGKKAGKDESAGKQTYPRFFGVEASRAAADEAVQAAIQELAPFGPVADDLRDLARFTVTRDY